MIGMKRLKEQKQIEIMNEKMVIKDSKKDELACEDSFFKCGLIIGFVYAFSLGTSYYISIHILKMLFLKPIFYLAALIGIIFAEIYVILAIMAIWIDIAKEAENSKNNKNNGQ